MTKIKKHFICSYLLLSVSLMGFGQETIKVEGFLNRNDKKQTESTAATRFVLVKMMVADTVFQSTFLNRDGFFEFYKPSPAKNFEVKFYYFDYAFQPVIRFDKSQKNRVVLNYSFDLIRFESEMKIKNFKLPECVTLETFGLPNLAYEGQLRHLSWKYGFRYRSMGCGYIDEKEVNKEAIQQLNKSLGYNWYDVFWKEVKIKLK